MEKEKKNCASIQYVLAGNPVVHGRSFNTGYLGGGGQARFFKLCVVHQKKSNLQIVLVNSYLIMLECCSMVLSYMGMPYTRCL